jgi:hypothetical protein
MMAHMAYLCGAHDARQQWIAAYGINSRTPSIATFRYSLKKWIYSKKT